MPHSLSGRAKVAEAGVILIVKKTSVEYTVIINDSPPCLPWITLLNLLVLMLAIADVCHGMQYYEQVVDGSERSKCLLPDSYRNLPFRPSSKLSLIGLQDNLLYSSFII
jgi:hypothetical protein